MNRDARVRANLGNLESLWRAMGSEPVADGWEASLAWPHRLWRAAPDATTAPPREVLAGAAHRDWITPVWRAESDAPRREVEALQCAGFGMAFAQTAMLLSLNHEDRSAVPGNDPLELRRVESESSLADWATLAGNAFGYAIDTAPLRRLTRHDGATLWLARQGECEVGTALTFVSDGVVGVHQVGVAASHQGRGVGRLMMGQVLARAYEEGHATVVLQASEAGRPLYLRLGFETLFQIDNYAYGATAAR